MNYQIRLRYGGIDCLDFIDAESMLHAQNKAVTLHSQSLQGMKLADWATDSLIQCARTVDGIRFSGKLTVSKLIV